MGDVHANIGWKKDLNSGLLEGLSLRHWVLGDKDIKMQVKAAKLCFSIPCWPAVHSDRTSVWSASLSRTHRLKSSWPVTQIAIQSISHSYFTVRNKEKLDRLDRSNDIMVWLIVCSQTSPFCICLIHLEIMSQSGWISKYSIRGVCTAGKHIDRNFFCGSDI